MPKPFLDPNVLFIMHENLRYSCDPPPEKKERIFDKRSSLLCKKTKKKNR